MNARFKIVLLSIVLLAFILLSTFQWSRSQSNKNSLEATVGMVSTLQLIVQEEAIQMLRSNTVTNNDTLAELEQQLQHNARRMIEQVERRHPALPGITPEYLRGLFKRHHERLEDFKSYHAVIKNSILQIESMIEKRLHGAPETAFIDDAMLNIMQRFIINYFQNTIAAESYDIPPPDPAMGSTERMLLRHLNTVLSYDAKIRELNAEIDRDDVGGSLARMRRTLKYQIGQVEEGITQLGTAMFVSSVLFLMMGIFAYSREIKSRENADRLSRELEQTNRELAKENRRSMTLARQFEQFARALDESAIVSKTDARGIITYVNQKFLDISGYDRDELLGRPHNIIRHPDMPSELFDELWKTIREKRVFKATIKNRRKDGSSYFVDSVIIPITGIDGEIDEYLAVRYNVSELVETRDSALAAQRAKDRFLANMSHELRTPLNAIGGFTQIMLRKTDDPMLLKYLAMVRESSEKLLHLINDILDLSKIQSGKFSLDVKPFALSQSLEALLERFRTLAEANRVTLVTEIEESARIQVVGDWMRISQVLTNLLSNAIKFTPESGSVTVVASYRDSLFRCSVADTGIGMTPETQERIFNPFEQADDSTTREYGGTGLGLSISKELVAMMEGTLSLQSEVGRGSRFEMQLPLAALTPRQESNAEERTGPFEPLHGHILVAEDNPANREVIALMLAEIGLTCDIVSDGVEAMERFDPERHDLILMDQNMPRMNGIEAMRGIREEHAGHVPVIALTANVMVGDRERFLEAGMDDFIGKPIDLDILYGTLSRHLS